MTFLGRVECSLLAWELHAIAVVVVVLVVRVVLRLMVAVVALVVAVLLMGQMGKTGTMVVLGLLPPMWIRVLVVMGLWNLLKLL